MTTLKDLVAKLDELGAECQRLFDAEQAAEAAKEDMEADEGRARDAIIRYLKRKHGLKPGVGIGRYSQAVQLGGEVFLLRFDSQGDADLIRTALAEPATA